MRPLAVILAFALIASAAGPVLGKLVNHPSYSLAVDGDLEMLVWVSQDVLNASDPPADFPAGWWSTTETARVALHRQLSTAKGQVSECPSREKEAIHWMPAPGEGSSSLSDYVDFSASLGLVVIGTVTQVELGAKVFGDVEIAPRVRVVVSEVLRDTEGAIVPGDELTFVGSGGRLRLGRQQICATEAPEREVPEAGTRVILTGSHQSGDPAFTYPSALFPVRGETVELPAGTRFKNRTVPLGELRRAISRADEERER